MSMLAEHNCFSHIRAVTILFSIFIMDGDGAKDSHVADIIKSLQSSQLFFAIQEQNPHYMKF